MITLSCIRAYKKPIHNPVTGALLFYKKVFVYKVQGTVGELKRYTKKMREHYREDDQGNPLYFSFSYFQSGGNWDSPVKIKWSQLKFPVDKKKGK